MKLAENANTFPCKNGKKLHRSSLRYANDCQIVARDAKNCRQNPSLKWVLLSGLKPFELAAQKAGRRVAIPSSDCQSTPAAPQKQKVPAK